MRRFGRPALVVCSVVVVAFLVVQVVALNDEVSSEAFVGEMRPRVLATARIMRDHEPIASTNIFGIPYLTEPSTSTIARLDRNGELPALDVSTADVLTAREYVGAVIGDASKYPEGVVRTVDDHRTARRGAAAPGCLDRRADDAGRRAGRAARAPGRGFVPGGDRSGRRRVDGLRARATPPVDRAGSPTAPGGGTGVGVPRPTERRADAAADHDDALRTGHCRGSEPLSPRWQTAHRDVHRRAPRRRPGPDRGRDPRAVHRIRRRLLGPLRPRARVPVGLLRPPGGGRLARAGHPRGVRRRRARHHRRRGDAPRDRAQRRGDERLLGRAPHRVRAQPGREVRQRPVEGHVPPPRRRRRPPRRVRRDRARRRHRHRPHHHAAPSPTATAAGASTAARSGPPRRWSRRSCC